MNELGPKQPRLRLNPDSYDQLRHQVLRRDGWRCQSCGTMSNLEVHHKQLRGQSGRDSDQNLIYALRRMPCQSPPLALKCSSNSNRATRQCICTSRTWEFVLEILNAKNGNLKFHFCVKGDNKWGLLGSTEETRNLFAHWKRDMAREYDGM